MHAFIVNVSFRRSILCDVVSKVPLSAGLVLPSNLAAVSRTRGTEFMAHWILQMRRRSENIYSEIPTIWKLRSG